MHITTPLLSLSLLALNTPFTLALTITSPPSGFTQDTTQPQRITWTSVSTDPSTLSIQLVNFSKFPNYNKTLATNVATSAGSFVNPANNDDGQTGTGFQINLLGAQGPNPAGILAQSPQFTLVNGASSSSTSRSSSSSASGSSSSTPRPSSSGTTTPITTPRPSGGTSVPFPGNGTISSGTARTTGASSGTARSTGGGASGSGTARSSSASGSARPSQFNGTANALERQVGGAVGAAVVLGGLMGWFA